MRAFRALSWLPILAAVASCDNEAGQVEANETGPAEEREAVSLAGDWDARLDPAELERGRLDPAWRSAMRLDTLGAMLDTTRFSEAWEEISSSSVNDSPMRLPVRGDAAGPSVLRVQILLDRALFSPGVIDGRWGKNTEKAVYWFQFREGLQPTGQVDSTTFQRLAAVAGGGPELIRTHVLTADDVAGPFVSIPEDIYEKAELECMCFESLEEKLAEQFHTTPELLQQLNADVDLDSLAAGASLQVPVVRDPNAGRGVQVARIEISGEGFYVHALDAAGRILFHFPSTLGSSFDPSPQGDHRVVRITPDPWWHYQPSILAHVEDDEPEAKIPPGPNNAVGVVWMALSAPHYGIHGTSAPETIGYTTSAGCVRLTNWDAKFLSERIAEGVPVVFSGTRDGSAPGEAN